MPLVRIGKRIVWLIQAANAWLRNAILEALRASHWNRRKAAESLKISYRALIYKIRDLK